jgi:hypothetical protein
MAVVRPIVSKDGLVLTNHHCGYDAIAELSSANKNYLKDGYWAPNRSAELSPRAFLCVSLFGWTTLLSASCLSLRPECLKPTGTVNEGNCNHREK